LLHPTRYDFDRFDSVSVEQAFRKPIKVRSKLALRLTRAWARNARIVVSADRRVKELAYGGMAPPCCCESAAVGSNQGHATISNYYSKQRLEQPLNVGGRRYSAWKSPDFRNVSRAVPTFLSFLGD
jgi:hypothetical protein